MTVTNVSGCGSMRGISNPQSIAMSDDGRNVYLAGTNAVAVFSRDPSSGVLTQLSGTSGCVNGNGNGTCTAARGLGAATGSADVAVSPGQNGSGGTVYFANGHAIVAFSRDASSGALTQLSGAGGCVNASGNDGAGGSCLKARGGTQFIPAWLYATSDMNSLYAGSGNVSSVLSIFRRNPTTGALSQATDKTGCVSNGGVGPCETGPGADATNGMVASGDGRYAYVASSYDAMVDVFSRDGGTGALTQVSGPAGCAIDADSAAGSPCTSVRGLKDVRRPALSPEGHSLYVAANGGGLVRLTRDPVGGGLTQPTGAGGCITGSGNDGETPAGLCTSGHGLDLAQWPAVSPDGATVYVVAEDQSDIAILRRNVNFGSLTQGAGTGGCVGISGNTATCGSANAISGLDAVVVSSDGANVYGATSAGLVAFGRTQPARYTVTASSSPSADGTVIAESSASGSSCTGNTCSVYAGSNVTLTELPVTGWYFTGWTGACSGTSPVCTLNGVSSDQTATAHFAIFRVTVSATALPPSVGAVDATSSSPNASCSGGTCTVDYGSTVTLTAKATAARWGFYSWSGACAGQPNSCVLTSVGTNAGAAAQMIELVPPQPIVVPLGPLHLASATVRPKAGK